MKTLKSILIICVVVFLAACEETGSVQIQNNISQVEIVDVKWGKFYVATGLLPGEASSKKTITDDDVHFPAANIVSFKMVANNKTIYLETEEQYTLNEDQDLLIVLTDETKVKNPNE